MKIGELIRQLRSDRDMTLEEVAKIIGVSRQTMSRYETGAITSIPYDNIIALANLFNVHPAYLMGWKEKSGLVTSAMMGYDTFCDDDTFDGMPDEWRKLHSKIDSASGAKRELIDKVLTMTDEQATAWNAVLK